MVADGKSETEKPETDHQGRIVPVKSSIRPDHPTISASRGSWSMMGLCRAGYWPNAVFRAAMAPTALLNVFMTAGNEELCL
jgi:hypothetical protein